MFENSNTKYVFLIGVLAGASIIVTLFVLGVLVPMVKEEELAQVAEAIPLKESAPPPLSVAPEVD